VDFPNFDKKKAPSIRETFHGNIAKFSENFPINNQPKTLQKSKNQRKSK
jgi:hypothetical protein